MHPPVYGDIQLSSVTSDLWKVFLAMIQVLQKAALEWDRYTHIAFTSRNGIQAFLDALGACHGLDEVLARLRNGGSRTVYCALGADAELLHSVGIIDVLIPQEVRVPRAVLLRYDSTCKLW